MTAVAVLDACPEWAVPYVIAGLVVLAARIVLCAPTHARPKERNR